MSVHLHRQAGQRPRPPEPALQPIQEPPRTWPRWWPLILLAFGLVMALVGYALGALLRVW